MLPEILLESELILAIKNKSARGAKILYDKYSHTLFYNINRIVKSRTVAEDILQQTFIKIWDSFHQYDQQKGRLYTWMINIARNLCFDELRKKHYQYLVLSDNMQSSASYFERNHHEIINTDLCDIGKFLNQLRKIDAKVMYLIYIKGYTHVEVAENLNIPLGTVKTRIANSIKLLKMYLQKDIAMLKLAS
ncbi:RNA polymerase sigma-70 factor, ECF subfamily [Mucilaginibacter pineti]|uniref:RNA polymerase sigma-70 factor, ECF subfamily n=1 Tax=Mucilaginibacter pineti TaxID=1391627 RepID=A0A1G7L3Q6_9SPHI|nr:sigma-70 family RNA polymerase sigma factor [Mucilaginibacter pineti]SDF44137.1 RNA polymerase sigma-70 factor, ECF subfamily [Mucilaginibacter pineti]